MYGKVSNCIYLTEDEFFALVKKFYGNQIRIAEHPQLTLIDIFDAPIPATDYLRKFSNYFSAKILSIHTDQHNPKGYWLEFCRSNDIPWRK